MNHQWLNPLPTEAGEGSESFPSANFRMKHKLIKGHESQHLSAFLSFSLSAHTTVCNHHQAIKPKQKSKSSLALCPGYAFSKAPGGQGHGHRGKSEEAQQLQRRAPRGLDFRAGVGPWPCCGCFPRPGARAERTRDLGPGLALRKRSAASRQCPGVASKVTLKASLARRAASF